MGFEPTTFCWQAVAMGHGSPRKTWKSVASCHAGGVRPVQESRPNRGDLDTERTLGLPGLRGEYWAWDDSPDAGRLALSVAPRLQLIDSRRNRELGVFDVRSGGSDSVDTTTPVGQAASRQFCLAPFASTYDRGDYVTALVQEESRRERLNRYAR